MWFAQLYSIYSLYTLCYMLQVQHILYTSVQVTIVEDPYNFYTDTDSDPDPGY